MSKVEIMSESLANKIAAGEVVEKCASVVKELVENSIDAGSKTIKIELTSAGLDSIKVTDDGTGMDHDDALLAFQRHATSKLQAEEDLFFIETLGFRGEALPSIASVSEVELITSNGDVGTKIVIKGGKLISDENSDARRGTSIKVSNLFYNTPARLKYLKSEQTELANTVSYIERLALSSPHIAFTLTNNENIVVKTSGSDNLLKVIHEIYGLNISSKMLEVKGENDDYLVYGYVGKSEVLKSNRNHMITIVNGRVVRNNDLNRFINDAYYTYKPDNKYPIVILNILTDPSLIDVNIHPTKQDIKMSKIYELGDLINNTIKDALYQTVLIPNIQTKPVVNVEKHSLVEEKSLSSVEEQTYSEKSLFDYEYQSTSPTIEETSLPYEKNSDLKKLTLEPAGQIHGTYILAENEEGMFIIDQHAAQERINYEKNMQALKSKEISTIKLLFPITVELSASEFLTVKEHLSLLTDIGFVLEEFGINTFIFKEHPTWLKEGYEEVSIRKIIDLITDLKKDFNEVKFQENIAITLACKLSIKANYHVSMEAMEDLLTQLVTCDNPYTCPHGRPTIIKFTNYELEKMFKRVM